MCDVGYLRRDMKSDLRRFKFNYTRKGNQASEVFVWKTSSMSVTVNVDFTQEGMQKDFVNA